MRSSSNQRIFSAPFLYHVFLPSQLPIFHCAPSSLSVSLFSGVGNKGVNCVVPAELLRSGKVFIQTAPLHSTVRAQHLPLLPPDFEFSVTKALSAGQQLHPFLPVDGFQFAAAQLALAHGTWWLFCLYLRLVTLWIVLFVHFVQLLSCLK